MSSEDNAPPPGHEAWAIQVRDLGKVYRLYDKPHHRLMQSLWGERRRYYREFASLHGVSFELERGQTLGVIGRNGAGKSTLLQIICGTLAPSSGSVEVRGRVAALLELGTGFNPDFSGRENIHVNAAILGLTPAQIALRMDDIIAFADIGEFIDQPVKTYSSGMYVRLAFAVVVHVDPDILVVDEALAVGDAMFQAKCMTRMRRMLDGGMTLLFISHDISAVKALCKRTLWLDHGKIRAYGDTAEVTRAYDHDWIHQANAAQGIIAAPAAEIAHNLLEEQLEEGAAPSVGTQAVRLLAVGWGTQGTLGPQARASFGETLMLRFRLQMCQPCEKLVVSYHIKNRQNQHVLGGHTADRPDVYPNCYRDGDVLEVAFHIPMHLHQGDYALTLVVASIGDTQRYTDVVFHLWADDIATLHVTPRDAFPLSDLIEPPPVLTVVNQKPWVVLDDFFPNLLTGFRVAEYNAHLEAFPQLTVMSTLGDFADQHRAYAQLYPQYAHRVQPFAPEWLAGCGLAYINFLNNAAHYLPLLHEKGIPFVLTLYPGGGFGLDEHASDEKLAAILSSPLLRAVIVTQPVTEQYLRAFAQRLQIQLPELHRIDGVVVNSQYFEAQAPRTARFGTPGAPLNVCFVAECYMPLGANKGYPELIEAALALADVPQVQWHVVGGGFLASDFDVAALGGRLHYYGRLETSALRQFYAGMDLIVSPNRPRLLHPGNFDGFPTGCCVEAALSGVAVMATDALGQNPGFVDGQSIYLLATDDAVPLAAQIQTRIRHLLDHPSHLQAVAEAGQLLTQQLYAPTRQIGTRQQILRTIAAGSGKAGGA
jgi:lipopolysaccharide transport system ATP-binding protein